MHSNGYLHRDIKPENIFIRFEKEDDWKFMSDQTVPTNAKLERLANIINQGINIKIGDFGLARTYVNT